MAEYKGYRVEALGTFPMVKIQAKGRGTIPGKLGGVFTTTTEAFKAIDIYLNGMTKGRKNGKAEAPSTS
jgi:hypothetical protein